MNPRPSSPWAQLLALNALSDRRFVPFALSGMFGVLALRVVMEPFGDQDAGWIARAGRETLATGAVPRFNAWSITDASVPWVMHEWALGPLYAVAMQRLGLAGPMVIGLAASALTTALLIQLTVGKSRNLGAGALACLLVLVLTRECLFQPRPAYVCLGLPLLMAWLALGDRMSTPRAVACVALELAWANLHGSFPLGIGLLALGLSRSEDRRARSMALVAASIATLATPYGTSLLSLVARYVGGGDSAAAAIHDHIAEFQPLWAAGDVFGGPPRIVAVVIVAVVAFASVLAGSRTERLDALFALALAGLAVLQSRHVPQAVTLGLVLSLPALDRLVDRSGIVSIAFAREVAHRTTMLVAALALLACVSVCVVGAHADDALGGDSLPGLVHDPRVVGRAIYAPFDAAGRVLWLADADARVFFDPRNDCYRAETALAAYAIEEGDCTGTCLEQTLTSAGVDVALVPDAHPIAETMSASRVFRAVRREGDWQLFVRSDP